MVDDTVTSLPHCLFCSATTENGKDKGGSFKLLR